MIVTARDLLARNVVRVPAEARPAGYESELASGRIVAFAVFDGETFLGLAEPARVAIFPQRIFADLCAGSGPPIAEDTPLEEIIREMDRRGTTVLAVASAGNAFLGVVSSFRITELLLWQAESRLQGIRQLLATTVDLGSDATLEDVLQRVVELAAQLTDAREGSLEILDEGGTVTQTFKTGARPRARSLVREAAASGMELSAPGPGEPPPGARGGTPPAGTVLETALRLRNRTLGRLTVWNKEDVRAFTGEDRVLLVALADQAAIAIENATLFQAQQEQLEALRRTRARLEQAEKLSAMGELLASVAHELNNPLAALVGHAELLERLLAGTPHAARARQITQAGQRCARIVRNYLALARQRPPRRQAVDVNGVIRDALELLAYALRVDDVETVLDLADDLPPVAGDPQQLHQVIVNLMTNAQHALREVAPPRRLRLATRRQEGDRVEIEVSDTGPGIPEPLRGRIFEPFYTTKSAGTGLGLALCQSIVQAHGGAIALEGGAGAWATTFRVVVPRGHLPPDDGGSPPAAGRAMVRGRRILVVDDEPGIREIIAEILAEDDHEVDHAANGVEALARLERGRYDLILLDVRMPAGDGPGFYRAAIARAPALRRRFLFITGDVLDPQVRAFLEEVQGPVVRKPFTIAELREAVQERLASTGGAGRGGRTAGGPG